MDAALAETRSVLAIQVSRIGDTLLATPALRALAHALPQATLTCAAHPKRREILEHLPFIHRLESIDKRRAPWRGWLGGKRYDLAVVFGFDKPLVAYALRVARRVAAFRQDDAAIDARLYRAVAPPAFQSVHAVDYLLAVTDALGIERDGRHLTYQVTPAEADWAAHELAPLVGRAPLVGLQIASFPTKGYRDWPVEHFVELCRRILAAAPNAHFLIFGGGLERERTQALHVALAECSTHYAGRLSLRQTAALMDRLDLYVGVDTGPTHIMGALHRPMVAMYHAYSPSRLLAPLEHPCLYAVDHPHADQAGPEASMSDIGVDTVWERVATALREHPARPRP